MARLGELVLRGGRAGDRQVVSREWLEGSFTHAAGPIDWPRPVYYGRLWWLFPPSGPATADVVTASGAGGQWIFVVPPLELVVVFTADQANPASSRPWTCSSTNSSMPYATEATATTPQRHRGTEKQQTLCLCDSVADVSANDQGRVRV
jgi:CubicO group peptidase (beta-lactamase class C family)